MFWSSKNHFVATWELSSHILFTENFGLKIWFPWSTIFQKLRSLRLEKRIWWTALNLWQGSGHNFLYTKALRPQSPCQLATDHRTEAAMGSQEMTLSLPCNTRQICSSAPYIDVGETRSVVPAGVSACSRERDRKGPDSTTSPAFLVW